MLCLLLLAVGGIVWSLSDNNNPAALWAWGWGIVLGLGGFLQFWSGDAIEPSISLLLSPLLPGFMVAGAMAYADQKTPRWLLPGALAVGCCVGCSTAVRFRPRGTPSDWWPSPWWASSPST